MGGIVEAGTILKISRPIKIISIRMKKQSNMDQNSNSSRKKSANNRPDNNKYH